MKIKSNKVKDIRDYYLVELNKEYPRREAVALLDIAFEDLLGISRMKRILDPDLRLSESEILKIHFAFKDLLKQKPIQYIVGFTEFYGLKLQVDNHVLIPRPETEELVQWIISEAAQDKGMRIIDIGTGSGAIALALKYHLKNTEVWTCDISKRAIDIAIKNAASLGLDIKIIETDILDENHWTVFPLFDTVVSNPPYVTFTEKKLMQDNVLEYEPAQALFVNDDDPLIFYRKIIQFSLTHLIPGGKIYFEINEKFGPQLEKLLSDNNFENIILRKDINDRDRMICGKKLP